MVLFGASVWRKSGRYRRDPLPNGLVHAGRCFAHCFKRNETIGEPPSVPFFLFTA
jgi:hypothetical protein